MSLVANKQNVMVLLNSGVTGYSNYKMLPVEFVKHYEHLAMGVQTLNKIIKKVETPIDVIIDSLIKTDLTNFQTIAKTNKLI